MKQELWIELHIDGSEQIPSVKFLIGLRIETRSECPHLNTVASRNEDVIERHPHISRVCIRCRRNRPLADIGGPDEWTKLPALPGNTDLKAWTPAARVEGEMVTTGPAGALLTVSATAAGKLLPLVMLIVKEYVAAAPGITVCEVTLPAVVEMFRLKSSTT